MRDSEREKHMSKLQTVLVTGGAGYVGSHVAWELLEQGYDVVVVDNLQQGHRDAVPPEAVLVEADLADRKAVVVTPVLRVAVDSVLHAQLSRPRRRPMVLNI